MTAALLTCPDCGGAGVLGECANDGTHGCSHTNDREWVCPTCDGECDVTPDVAAAYDAEQAARAAEQAAERERYAARRRVETVAAVDSWLAWPPVPF